MSATPIDPRRAATRKDLPTQAPAPAASPAPSAMNLAPPPKLRRRPILIAASVAAICLGALVSVWAYTSSSVAHEVLAVRETVQRGDTIERADLISVRIGVDPALQPLPTSEIGSVIGKRAALDMPAGGVVTQAQIASSTLPAKGASVVGILLSAGKLPADQLRVGDKVRVVTTPGEQGDVTADEPDAIAAVVVAITQDATSGDTVVNVQVPFEDAPDVAARAATSKVAVILDSLER